MKVVAVALIIVAVCGSTVEAKRKKRDRDEPADAPAASCGDDAAAGGEGLCSMEKPASAEDSYVINVAGSDYSCPKKWKKYCDKVDKAFREYVDCGDHCYGPIVQQQLAPWKGGIKKDLFDAALSKVPNLIHYQIIGGKLYRSKKCYFPMRCEGIEYFIIKILQKQALPDMEFILNVADYPQTMAGHGQKLPIFSFSKDGNWLDPMYPAWAFWAGGPCVSTEKNCLGRWDLKRDAMINNGYSWKKKKKIAFFRGSRTAADRDPLIRIGQKFPDLVEARYTKNQAWKSPADTMHMEPAPEMRLEDHCRYRYLFNFRGVAASFRHRHLFLCNSLVLHVGDEWLEFYYSAMKPWVHYVPVAADFSDAEELIQFVHANDALVQRVAAAGHEWVKAHLRMDDVANYWYMILKQYASLQTWETKKHRATTHRATWAATYDDL